MQTTPSVPTLYRLLPVSFRAIQSQRGDSLWLCHLLGAKAIPAQKRRKRILQEGHFRLLFSLQELYNECQSSAWLRKPL